MLNEESEERQARYLARFQTLSEKSDNCRREADVLGEEIQALQVGDERRNSCASQFNGSCFDPTMVEQFIAAGAAQAMQQLARIQGEICRVYGWQHQPEPTAPKRVTGGKEKEEWEGAWDKEKAASVWYQGATVDPAVDLVWCQNANVGSLGGRNPGTKKWKAAS